MHGLKQLIDSPTRVTENTSSLLDHILTNTHDKISQVGVIDAGLSGEIKVAAAARVGREDQKLWYGKLKVLAKTDLGKEPHSLVVPSRLHFTEKDFLESL